MSKKNYCIKHSRMVDVAGGPFIDVACHFGQDVSDEDWPCYGPFTATVPPELPENWIDMVSEPSEDELDEMDENALSLLADFTEVENVVR